VDCFQIESLSIAFFALLLFAVGLTAAGFAASDVLQQSEHEEHKHEVSIVKKHSTCSKYPHNHALPSYIFRTLQKMDFITKNIVWNKHVKGLWDLNKGRDSSSLIS